MTHGTWLFFRQCMPGWLSAPAIQYSTESLALLWRRPILTDETRKVARTRTSMSPTVIHDRPCPAAYRTMSTISYFSEADGRSRLASKEGGLFPLCSWKKRESISVSKIRSQAAQYCVAMADSGCFSTVSFNRLRQDGTEPAALDGQAV